MAQRGGARPGAGRKKGVATLVSERVRAYIAESLEENLGPIVEKAIELAKGGDKAARDWLTDHGIGKATQAVEISNPDGSLKTIIIQKDVRHRNDKSAS